MKLLLCQLTLMAFSLGAVSQAAENTTLRAGVARVEITPPLGFPMWGYAARRDAPSVGVLDPLFAKALVLSSGGKGIALVSLDLGRAPARDEAQAIRKEVKRLANIDAIFLVASHTHHGPVLETRDWPDAKKPYTQLLQAKLIEVIVSAAKAAQPARLGFASHDSKLNRNRHSRQPQPPVDRELLVLRVENEQGKPIAHAVNFAAHPTMRPASLCKFSADWPGVMANLVEKETGVPCLYLQGAAGDLSADQSRHRGPEAFGGAVATEVLELNKTLKCQPLQSGKIEIREDDFVFSRRLDLGNRAVRAVYESAFFPALVAFYEREYREGVRPHLTTVLLDGRFGLVGASGEFFCAHALELKRRARLERVLFLGYCNDYQQYFPTIEGAGEGGYGADATMSPVEVGAGEQMINRALIHLYRMRGKMPDLPATTTDGK